MYIDYEKIGNKLCFGKEFFYNLKVKQNLGYIKKNQKSVLKKLKNKKCLKVVFYVYDESKWKSQTVYDLMESDERFNPTVVVTKNCAPSGNPNFQTADDVKRCYEFFKKKGMKVEYGYSIEQDNYISFETFSPDIIIYSHPWYVYKTQGPVVCSKFALTFYIPYFLPASEQWHEYGLRFHQYIYRHYVPTDFVKEFYTKNTDNIGEKYKVVGHPILDNYLKKEQKEKKYIIYAPHWTVCGDNLRYGTFDWSGRKILEFAKEHKNLSWVFRPHPLLYKFILSSNFMPKDEIDKYYDEWKKIGIYSQGGDYTDIFLESCAMITDCGSFLTEYFVTENPVIHLISKEFKPNPMIDEIDKTYYTARNAEELNQHLQEVIENGGDYKKDLRKELLKNLNLKDKNSAKLIINDILDIIGEKNGQ